MVAGRKGALGRTCRNDDATLAPVILRRVLTDPIVLLEAQAQLGGRGMQPLGLTTDEGNVVVTAESVVVEVLSELFG